jgi:hypothetical protein
MLSKQVWRLIANPDSVCAQVLRAKYYTDGDILKAGPKAGSSFTWQSIIVGIQLFKRGCILRIGNGESVHIWNDPWIPSSDDRKIMTHRGGCLLSKVRPVLHIPLYLGAFDYFLSWHGTRTGIFS